jgi:hypothetical protein
MTHAASALDLSALVDDLGALVAELDHVETIRRYQRDAWAWISECVTTVDELDAQTPIKPFPVGVCVPCTRYVGHAQRAACPRCGARPAPLAYLETLTRQWQSATPPLLIVPKARRMRLSWLFVALHTWGALHWPHAKIFIVSSKEDKSAELVERAHGILARVPEVGGGGRVVARRAAPPTIELDNGATITGVAEGASQLRQFTATAILADEFGHWMQPRETFSAMRPTIDGGGRLTIVSSAYPGTFAELVRGEFLAG